MKFNWKFVILATVLIYAVTFLLGFGIGMAEAIAKAKYPAAPVVTNFVTLIAGFTIVGCLVPANRWSNLAAVVLGSWILTLPNIFLGLTFAQWLLSLVFLAVVGGVAGVLSIMVNALMRAAKGPAVAAPRMPTAGPTP